MMDVRTGPWDYESIPEYRIGSTVYGTLVTKTRLDDAVRFYAANFVPLRGVGNGAWIIDGREVIVLGCWNRPDEPPFWSGVAEGYRTLEQFHNPLEVACWELEASGTVARIESEMQR